MHKLQEVICPICGCHATKNNFLKHDFKEMMFGFNSIFSYIECPECRSLFIEKIPEDIYKYYPENEYYSFNNLRKPNKLIVFLRRKRLMLISGKKSLIGLILDKIIPKPKHHLWLKHIGINYNLKILDIGCGVGKLLYYLKSEGFKNLTGIDPYLKKNLKEKGINILKMEIQDLVDDDFEVIIFNHSFEHIPNPEIVLNNVARIMKRDANVIIVMPIYGSYASKKYGKYWVGLDVPRHIHILSLKGMEMLAKRTGFEIDRVIFCSDESQFWGSEQYKHGISLTSSESYAVNKRKSIFNRKDIKLFRKLAKELNNRNDGDQAIFILSKRNDVV